MALIGPVSSSVGFQSIALSGTVIIADAPAGPVFPTLPGIDTTFFVSGSSGTRGTVLNVGTSVFGGDLHVSGNLTVNGTAPGGTIDGSGAATRIAYWSDADTLTSDADLIFDGDTLTAANSSNTAIPAITIDRNYTGTTSIGNLVTDPQGLLVDYDVTGIVASGQGAFHDAIAINYNQDSPTMVGTIVGTGADIRMTGGGSGTQTIKGVAITLAGGADNIGIDITAPNDSAHFIARSSDSITDYFQISVGESGATHLSTNDAGASVGNLTLDADGKIIIDAIAGDETVFNEGGLDVDFRVESSGEDEAIFLNAGSGKLHFNKGKSAFTTTIWSNNDNALEVNSSGVTLNELGNAANDFRVETNTKTHGLFVDAGADTVLILSGGGAASPNEAAFADLSFFVSGTVGSRGLGVGGASLFGGDLHVSGNLTVGGTAPGGGRSVSGDTDNGIITWVTSDDTFASEANFTFDGTNGLIASTGKLQFNNANTYIKSTLADMLDVVASTELNLSGSATKVICDLPNWTAGMPVAGVGGGLSLRQLGTGAGMTAGAVYYLSGTGTWTAAQASHIESGSMNFMSVAGTAVIEGDMFVNGPVNVAAAQFDGGIPSLSGSALYLSKNTAGSFTATAPTGSGEVVKVLGHCIGLDATKALVWFNPEPGWIELS